MTTEGSSDHSVTIPVMSFDEYGVAKIGHETQSTDHGIELDGDNRLYVDLSNVTHSIILGDTQEAIPNESGDTTIPPATSTTYGVVKAADIADFGGGITSKVYIDNDGTLLVKESGSSTLSRNVTVTTPVGNLAKGTVFEEGTELSDIISQMLESDSNPTITQPKATISITEPSSLALEVGTVVPSIKFTINFDPGKFSDNYSGPQPTGITAQTYSYKDVFYGQLPDRWEPCSNTVTINGPFAITDTTRGWVEAQVTHSESSVPTTYLGTPYPQGQIKAGTVTATSSYITGYRNWYWGYRTGSNLIDILKITAEQIKALGSKSGTVSDKTINTTNMQQIIVAVPTKLGYTKMTVENPSTGLPQTVKQTTAMVGGVNDYSPIQYTVFYVSNDLQDPAEGTYSIKLSK